MIETIIAWALFYILHSWLASFHVKNFIKQNLTGFNPFYRFAYNVISVLTFVLAWYVQRSMASSGTYFQYEYQNIAAGAIFISGLFLGYLAFRKYDLGEFIGLSSIETQELVITGLNKWMRHPLYTATLIMLIGSFVYQPNQGMLIFLSISCIYIFVGAHLEEKKLIKKFGQSYVDYKDSTRMIIPFII